MLCAMFGLLVVGRSHSSVGGAALSIDATLQCSAEGIIT